MKQINKEKGRLQQEWENLSKQLTDITQEKVSELFQRSFSIVSLE